MLEDEEVAGSLGSGSILDAQRPAVRGASTAVGPEDYDSLNRFG